MKYSPGDEAVDEAAFVFAVDHVWVKSLVLKFTVSSLIHKVFVWIPTKKKKTLHFLQEIDVASYLKFCRKIRY